MPPHEPHTTLPPPQVHIILPPEQDVHRAYPDGLNWLDPTHFCPEPPQEAHVFLPLPWHQGQLVLPAPWQALHVTALPVESPLGLVVVADFEKSARACCSNGDPSLGGGAFRRARDEMAKMTTTTIINKSQCQMENEPMSGLLTPRRNRCGPLLASIFRSPLVVHSGFDHTPASATKKPGAPLLGEKNLPPSVRFLSSLGNRKATSAHGGGLSVADGGDHRIVRIDRHGGLRHPTLERIEASPIC